MMILSVSSQNITKDSVTIDKDTFKSIIRDSKKCDSLAVAYIKKSIDLETVTSTNITLFESNQELREERLRLDERLQQLNNEFSKVQKRKTKNDALFAIGGTVVGLVVGNLVFK